MTTAGANPTGQKQDDIRTVFFGQDIVNTNWNGQNNPLGNTVTSQFPGVQQFARARLSLAVINLFNSWYNITAARGNNTFSYVFPNAGVYTNYNVVIDDGSFETIEEINEWLEAAMFSSKNYLIYYDKETGESTPTYFINLSTSTYKYAYELTLTPLPAAISIGNPTDASASGYYSPTGGPITAADEGLLPQFIILATFNPAGSNTSGRYSFSKTTGFNPGTYGAQGAHPTLQQFSQFPPQIGYSSVINVACNLVNMGDVNRNPQVFFQFVPNAPFGELISVVPPYPVFVPVGDGFYSYVQISLFDENFNPLQNIDPQIYGMVIVQG